MLVDAAAYFGALRRALRTAERCIYIVGWDIDSRTRLCDEGGAPEDGLPLTLGEFLKALVHARPELTVKLLLWDYSVLYTLEREPLPTVMLQWRTPKQIDLCIDDFIPLWASHHQKIVIVDDALAFSGGLDLTIRRWDTPDHRCANSHRVDPAGESYAPFHDVQMMVDGEAARALTDLVRDRWRQATGQTLKPVERRGDPWPERTPVQFRDVAVGISRTRPRYEYLSEVREVEALFHDMIAAARRAIYIETQFLTVRSVADSLIAALRANPKLEVLIVSPRTLHTWLEQHTMLTGRYKFMQRLVRAGLEGRVGLMHPHIRHGEQSADVMVHSKVMIVDDRFLRVGSANLCNRSMGTDTECDLTIEAARDEDRLAVARVRNRFLAEHTGRDPQEIGRRLDAGESLLTLAAETDGHRLLLPIRDETVPTDGSDAIEAVADPPEPVANIGAQKLRKAAGPRGPLFKLAAAAAVLAALVMLWRFTPLEELATAAATSAFLETYSAHPLAPLVTVLVFVVGGLVAFPVTVMIVATTAAFGLWPGILTAALGSLASAAAGYGVGYVIGTHRMHRLLGRRLKRIRRSVNRQGVMAVTTIRIVPVAPFTIINLVSGALRIRFVDFMIGTVLGLTPGFVILSLAGHRVSEFMADPSLADAALLGLVLAAWIGLTFALQVILARRREKR